jgi:DNA primase
VLSYDSDAAGQKAIMRGLDVMQEMGVVCKALQMEGAKDPDEYVLKYGPDKFNKLIDNSITAVEYKIKILKDNYNLNDTTDKIRFLNKMAEILSKVTNNIERDIYIEKLSKDLGVGKEALVAEVEKFLFKGDDKKVKSFSIPKVEEKKVEENTKNLYEEETILYLLTSKKVDVFNKIKSVVDVSDFKSSAIRNLASSIYEAYENQTYQNMDFTTLCTNEEETNILTKLMLTQNTSADYDKITDEVLQTFKLNKMQSRKAELLDLIKNCNEPAKITEYQNELNSIISNSARK